MTHSTLQTRIAIAIVLQSHLDTNFTEHFFCVFHNDSPLLCDDIILALVLEFIIEIIAGRS
jgi:hypothetical protein